MRFSFTCILSFLFLVTTAAAIPTPRKGHPASSLGRRDSYDDVVELRARSKAVKGGGTQYKGFESEFIPTQACVKRDAEMFGMAIDHKVENHPIDLSWTRTIPVNNRPQYHSGGKIDFYNHVKYSYHDVKKS